MKKFAPALLAASLAFSAAPTLAAQVCLDTRNIDHTKVLDSRHIAFHMKGGATYVNELKYACPGIRFHGFAYQLAGDTQVCSNMQTIHVLQIGSVCALGTFTPAPATHT